MKHLIRGDTVALIYPNVDYPARFMYQVDYIKEYLESLGLKVINQPDLINSKNLELKSGIITNYFANPEIKAIFPICSGNANYEIIEMLDYGVIHGNPKIICGYSSISGLILALRIKAEIPTFYGPHMSFLNSKSSQRENMYTVYSFLNLLFAGTTGSNRVRSNEKHYLYKYTPGKYITYRNIYEQDKYINTFCKKRVCTGEMFISSIEPLLWLCSHSNLQFQERFILMLDLLDIGPEEIIVYVSQLFNYLNIRKCECLIISSFSYYKVKEKIESPDAILSNLQKALNRQYGVELDMLYGFPVGHGKYKLTLPIGQLTSINVESGELKIVSPFEFSE